MGTDYNGGAAQRTRVIAQAVALVRGNRRRRLGNVDSEGGPRQGPSATAATRPALPSRAQNRCASAQLHTGMHGHKRDEASTRKSRGPAQIRVPRQSARPTRVGPGRRPAGPRAPAPLRSARGPGDSESTRGRVRKARRRGQESSNGRVAARASLSAEAQPGAVTRNRGRPRAAATLAAVAAAVRRRDCSAARGPVPAGRPAASA